MFFTSAALKTSTATKVLNGVQLALDVAGLVPGLGEIADGVNALIYLARGDKLNAGLSAAAMVPIAGWAATSGKLVTKSVQNMAPIVKNVAKKVAPVVVPMAKKVINTVTTVAAPIVKNAVNAVTTTVKDVTSSFVSGIKGFFNKATDILKDQSGKINFFGGNDLTKGAGKAAERSVIELGEQTLTKGNFAGRGSSAKLPRSISDPRNLKEQLAMEEVLSNPFKGSPVPVKKGMTDPRWPQTEGWVKYGQNVNGVEIHYLWNKALDLLDDFKIITN